VNHLAAFQLRIIAEAAWDVAAWNRIDPIAYSELSAAADEVDA
jgi:hypothetical protein